MGYHKLPKVEQMVADELIRRPETRNSDELLTVFVYRDFFGIGNEPYYKVMLTFKAMGAPSIKSIERCRRKLQEKHPKIYGCNDQTTRIRKASEIEFYDYAKE